MNAIRVPNTMTKPKMNSALLCSGLSSPTVDLLYGVIAPEVLEEY